MWFPRTAPNRSACAAFVDDDLIRAAAERFPAPSTIPVVIPEPTEKPRSSRASPRTKPETEGTAS